MKSLSSSIALFCLCFTGLIGSVSAQQTSGIGVALGKEGESFVVKQILPDSPTARTAAIQVGDRILEVAQGEAPAVPVQGLPLEEAVRLIRGLEGTTVRLTIVPSGKGEAHARVVTITRGEIKQLSRWGDGSLLAKGAAAPDVSWIRLAGREPEQFADFSGKVRVLEFWATWCGPCQPVMAQFQTYPEKYRNWADKVILITASVDDSPDSAQKRLEQKGWDKTHNVWVDTDAIKAYHVNALPTTYIIDQKGVVVSSGHVLDVPDVVNRLIRKN